MYYLFNQNPIILVKNFDETNTWIQRPLKIINY